MNTAFLSACFSIPGINHSISERILSTKRCRRAVTSRTQWTYLSLNYQVTYRRASAHNSQQVSKPFPRCREASQKQPAMSRRRPVQHLSTPLSDPLPKEACRRNVRSSPAAYPSVRRRRTKRSLGRAAWCRPDLPLPRQARPTMLRQRGRPRHTLRPRRQRLRRYSRTTSSPPFPLIDRWPKSAP